MQCTFGSSLQLKTTEQGPKVIFKGDSFVRKFVDQKFPSFKILTSNSGGFVFSENRLNDRLAHYLLNMAPIHFIVINSFSYLRKFSLSVPVVDGGKFSEHLPLSIPENLRI